MPTTTFSWAAPEAVGTALTTELNGLANGSYSAASSAIANQTGKYTHMAIELSLASLTPVAGQSVAIYLIPSIDASVYADGGGVVAPNATLCIYTFDLRAATAAQVRTAYNIPIPPHSFKLVVGNLSITSGVAFGATGNTLRYARYNMQGA